jgi:tryptophan synthase alpha chain
VCYVTAGHPDPERSVALLQGLEAAGADVIELGVPFSEPLADGPVIQHSSHVALGHGVDLAGSSRCSSARGCARPWCCSAT